MLKFLSLLPLFLIPTLSFANDKPILNVYTYNSFISEWGPGNQIKEGFETLCHCQVNFTTLGDGVMILNRLKLEGNKSKADIIIGLDNNLITEAQQSHLFIPLDITDIPLTIQWHNDYFIPYDYSYFSFIYNKEKISSPPESLNALLTSKEPWKIIYSDPRTSTPGLGLLLWIQAIYGDQSQQAWQQLAKKTLTVTNGWSEAYGLFLKNEADFVLSYTTSPVVHIINDHDYRYKSVNFSEGHYLQIEVAGITATSKQPQLAQQFLHFLLTPEIQTLIASKNIMYPVVDTLLPDAFNALHQVKHTIQLPAAQIYQFKKEWIKEWQNAISN